MQMYFDAIKNGTQFYTKVEFLNPDETVSHEITEDILQDESAFNITNASGTRRTGILRIDNWKNKYESMRNKLWINQKVKVSQGVRLRGGDIKYFPQGVYYIQNTSSLFNPSERIATFELVDKSHALENNIPGVYILTPGDDLLVAAQQLLLTDLGNGSVLDPLSPIVASYFLKKEYKIDPIITPLISNDDQYLITTDGYRLIGGSGTKLFIKCPYTAKIRGTYRDVMDEIATMLVASWGYDATGHLRFDPSNEELVEGIQPVLWNFSTDSPELLDIQYQENQRDMYNHVVVTGGVLNGRIAKGEAIDDDPRSAMYYKYIGKKTYYEEQSKYYTDAQCQELAEYYLAKFRKANQTVTITCLPMPHLRENTLITVQRMGIDEERVPYLISDITMPCSPTGVMTITASRVSRNEHTGYRLVESSPSIYPLGVYQLGTI